MAVTIRSLDGGLGLLEVGTGIMDGLQLEQAQAEFLTEERRAKLRYWLTDFSGVETSRTTSEQVLALAEAQADRESAMPDVVVAIVARLEVSLGMTRMWQLRLDARGTLWETRVFRIRAEAEDWLRERMREKHGIEIALA
jgi:hypothetical protein